MTGEIDPITGLPKELGIWEDITKESQTITVTIEKRKFGKKYTMINGIDSKEIDLKELCKKLKGALACGGTVKEGKHIELQGDHRQRVRDQLVKLGFARETIEIK